MKLAIDDAIETAQDFVGVADVRERRPGAVDPLPAPPDGHPLFARSPAMRELVGLATRAAQSSQMVCLVGEAGTGREVIAREVHRLSGGQADSFISIECSGRAAASLEADIFTPRRAAGRTTLYLAHLAEAPLETQVRLGRAIREGRESSGGSEIGLDRKFVASLDISVVAATEDGRLLPELADLLLPVDVPSLRQRKLDVPLLAEHLLKESADRQGTPARGFSRAAGSLLSALPWPGNTPELAALVDVVAASVDRPVVELDDVLAHLRLTSYGDRSEAGMTLRQARERFERECISAALTKYRGRMADAAQALGIQRTNLYRKIRQLKVPRAGRPTAR